VRDVKREENKQTKPDRVIVPVQDISDEDSMPVEDTQDTQREPPVKQPRMVQEIAIDSNFKMAAPKYSGRARSGAHMVQAGDIGHGSVAQMFMVEPGPRSYKAATADDDAEGWSMAIDSEKHSLVKHA